MIITRKALSRRTVLRGIGAGVALPLLDSMVPAYAALRTTAGAGDSTFRHRLRADGRRHGELDAGDRGGPDSCRRQSSHRWPQCATS